MASRLSFAAGRTRQSCAGMDTASRGPFSCELCSPAGRRSLLLVKRRRELDNCQSQGEMVRNLPVGPKLDKPPLSI